MARKLDSTTRLEAFSGGVMAVIITIIVLEPMRPHENGLASLYAAMPTLLVYPYRLPWRARSDCLLFSLEQRLVCTM